MNSIFQAKTVVKINAWNNPCVGVGITYTSQVGLRAFYKPCSKKFGSIFGHPYRFNITKIYLGTTWEGVNQFPVVMEFL